MGSHSRVSSNAGYRAFVISLTSLLNKLGIIGLLASTCEDLVGSPSIEEAQNSTIEETILLLRDIEIVGEIRGGIPVPKMRGSSP